MSQQELLKRVVHTLDDAGIDYMITGSVASSLQGEPRSTHDLDLVVRISARDAAALLSAFRAPEYYLDRVSIESAIADRGMFNLMHVTEGEKVDFWILSDDPFDQSRFARKYIEEVEGLKLKVSRPEDTILMKLKWAEMSGGSEKQFGDALHVYEVQHHQLDLDYLQNWTKTLGLQELWDRLQREAQLS